MSASTSPELERMKEPWMPTPWDVLSAWAFQRMSGRFPEFTPFCMTEPRWVIVGPSTRNGRGHAIIASPGVVLLWALACEIDDRGHTLTGEPVCPDCGGADGCADSQTDTVSLAWLVAHIATQRTSLVNDWPDQWRVGRDQERARGDESWQAQWWLAFEIWVTAGIEPDADLLAGLLRALTQDAPVVTEAEIVAVQEQQALADRRRIELGAVMPDEVRAQRFLHAPRPWFDIDVGTGRIYVDQITVERLPLDSHQSAGGYTFITPLAIPRETTIDITMSSVDVLPVGRAVHEGQIRAFDACRDSQTMMTMWVGGEVGSTEITNVWVYDVTTEREHQEGRMSSTFRCRTMEQPRVFV